MFYSLSVAVAGPPLLILLCFAGADSSRGGGGSRMAELHGDGSAEIRRLLTFS